jgi:pyrroline-5-carboxylate reductase
MTRVPNDTVQTFRDYRGTTAAAIDEMREAGFDNAVAAGFGCAQRNR